MGVLQLTPIVMGQVGVQPRTLKFVTTNSLSEITTAGYLNPNNMLGETLSPNDKLETLYGTDSDGNHGTFAILTPTINDGVITLNLAIQQYSAKLAALAAQTWAADQITYQTGTGTVGVTSLSSYMRALLEDDDRLSALGTLGIKYGVSAPYAGGTNNHVYAATGLVESDVVTVSLLNGDPDIAITVCVPGTDTLDVSFAAPAAASTIVQWIAVPTV